MSMKNWEKVQFTCAKDDRVLTMSVTLGVDYLLIHCCFNCPLTLTKPLLLVYKKKKSCAVAS